MARLVWRPEYSVGDPAVDHEHQELIDLVNQTADAIEAGEGADRIDRSFGDLLRSVSSHFALEEHQMRAASYDRLTEHKADHERLIDSLRDIMDGAATEPERSTERLVSTLDAWFADHFRTHDARLHHRLGPHDHP